MIKFVNIIFVILGVILFLCEKNDYFEWINLTVSFILQFFVAFNFGY